MRAHVGHADMLRGARERQVPEPDDAVLRGTASAARQRDRRGQQGGPDYAGDSVQRQTSRESDDKNLVRATREPKSYKRFLKSESNDKRVQCTSIESTKIRNKNFHISLLTYANMSGLCNLEFSILVCC